MKVNDRTKSDKKFMFSYAQVLENADNVVDAEVLQKIGFSSHVYEDWLEKPTVKYPLVKSKTLTFGVEYEAYDISHEDRIHEDEVVCSGGR